MEKKLIIFLFLISFFIGCLYRSEPLVNAKININDIEILHNNQNNESDYVFTTREINSAKITDTSINIYSDNLNKEFLENAKSITSNYGYDVSYENGELTIKGLIPDFFYNSLRINSESNDGENYILEINNFKTAKSQDPIKQFVTQTLQYTLKKYISPIDFYLWEHKILTKEVTPEEFVLRSLQDPKILYNINTNEEFLEKMYSAIFLSSLSKEETISWMNKFEAYKQKYFLKDDEVYNLLAAEMVQSEDFLSRINGLNIENREIPESTRYMEVFKDLKHDYKYNKNNDLLYVMDYDELNRTDMGENTAVLFLNEGFNDKLNANSKITVDIDNATAKYKNGRIIIEGLEPNTLYKNFTVNYFLDGVEKRIFVQNIKTVKGDDIKYSNLNVVNREFDFLDSFGYSMDEFLKDFYKKKYNVEIDEDEINYYKILFIVDKVKFEKYLNLVYKSDFDIKDTVLISKLYDIIFNRVPDEEGLNFWVNKLYNYKSLMGNSGDAIKKVIVELSDSEEFKNRFNSFIIQNIVKTNNQEKKQQNVMVASFFYT